MEESHSFVFFKIQAFGRKNLGVERTRSSRYDTVIELFQLNKSLLAYVRNQRHSRTQRLMIKKSPPLLLLSNAFKRESK